MRLFGDRTKLRGAAAGMLLGALTLSAFLGGCIGEQTDDPSTITEGTAGGKPDLHLPSLAGTQAMSKGGTSGSASQAAGGSAPDAGAQTEPAAPNPACTEASQCPSGFCVDGVCCNQACTGTCFSCNQVQSPGTCMPINGAEDASADAPCAGGNICTVSVDGQPACKLKSRQICSADADCASGRCGSIFVPPDPSDPYDVGYSYVGCE